MRHLGALVLLVSFGCENTREPIEPTPPVAPALQEFRLSGAVTDTANRPLATCKVEVVGGARAGTVAITDDAGRFSMPGTFTGNMTLAASKDGYLRETRSLLSPAVPVPPGSAGGAWEVVFHLEPLGPSANIAGVYTLTMTADSACSSLPAEARTRIYTATIVPGGRSNFFAGLSDARFFAIVPCPAGRPIETCTYNRFGIGIAGNFANIVSGGIVERLSETTYLVVTGGGGALLDPSGIMLPFDGSFQYCSSEPYQIDQGTWACTGNTGLECNSNRHQLALVRR